jgi:hypothetical protein
MRNVIFKDIMGATEGEVKALEKLTQITIIDFGSSEVQERIKKRKEVLDYTEYVLGNLTKDKISLAPCPEVANLIPINPKTVDEKLGFPRPIKLMTVCCPDCIGSLESGLCFKREILNVAPCGDIFLNKGDLCPFCGKLYVRSFCESITDFLAYYGYNRRFTKKKPLEMFERASKKQEFHYWKMEQFPHIFIDDWFCLIGCAIKSSS